MSGFLSFFPNSALCRKEAFRGSFGLVEDGMRIFLDGEPGPKSRAERVLTILRASALSVVALTGFTACDDEPSLDDGMEMEVGDGDGDPMPPVPDLPEEGDGDGDPTGDGDGDTDTTGDGDGDTDTTGDGDGDGDPTGDGDGDGDPDTGMETLPNGALTLEDFSATNGEAEDCDIFKMDVPNSQIEALCSRDDITYAQIGGSDIMQLVIASDQVGAIVELDNEQNPVALETVEIDGVNYVVFPGYEDGGPVEFEFKIKAPNYQNNEMPEDVTTLNIYVKSDMDVQSGENNPAHFEEGPVEIKFHSF